MSAAELSEDDTAFVAAETREAPTPPSTRVDTLADTMVLLLALTAVQRLVGFVRGVLFCRWLEPAELGEWDLAFGFLLLAAPLAVVGLPGSFGRYVEHYRQRGQLRSFLRHVTFITLLLSATAVAVVGATGTWFSELIFGRPDRVGLVAVLAASLGIVIAYNFIVELLTSLRLFRVVSGLQFAHSFLFATIGLSLLLFWQTVAVSVILAYAGACLLCAAASGWWLGKTWRELPACSARLTSGSLLAKLMPFAVWVWVTNWLSNLFDIADRYMLVHYSHYDAAEALAQVGNYHSSRVVPVLLVTVTAMLAGAALPHMSHEWEAGGRERVSNRVNLMFKLMTFALMFGAAVILWASPVLFDVAFRGKYSGGLAVLPWTLTYCVWFGVIGIIQNYLWCAEKAAWGSVAILVGVLVNIGLNFLLLPILGLQGAVLATAAANAIALSLTYAFSCRHGLKCDFGCLLVGALPPLLAAGPLTTLAVLAVFAWWAIDGERLLTRDDKQQLRDVWFEYRQRWTRRRAAHSS